MKDLQESIEDLYVVFGGYPLGEKLEGCAHCCRASADSALHHRPLQELTWDNFGVYPFKAMTTFGGVDDFKHFLPRVLELYATEPDQASYEVSLVFEKLHYAAWGEWPASEARAIREFVGAWLAALAVQASGSERASERLVELQEALTESGFHSAGAV